MSIPETAMVATFLLLVPSVGIQQKTTKLTCPITNTINITTQILGELNQEQGGVRTAILKKLGNTGLSLMERVAGMSESPWPMLTI